MLVTHRGPCSAVQRLKNVSIKTIIQQDFFFSQNSSQHIIRHINGFFGSTSESLMNALHVHMIQNPWQGDEFCNANVILLYLVIHIE